MEIYCSTGTFVGRRNGGNWHLLTRDGHRLRCDGFELMLIPLWYDILPDLIADLKASGLRFPVLHADKSIGDDVSSASDADFEGCVDRWRRNLETACAVGAGRVVTHIWGIPDSDKYLSRLYERVLRLREIALSYRLDMTAENCCCVYGSPHDHMRELLAMEPEMGFTVDTRPAQFHRELPALCADEALWHGAVRHLHISDFRGGEKDWKALYPIPAPGEGDVDYPFFFAHLKNVGYAGTATLESPCRFDLLDWDTMNRYLDFVRAGIA